MSHSPPRARFSQVTNDLWENGVRFIDRTGRELHEIMTSNIVRALQVTDMNYLEEIRPLATKTVLERLRKRLENVVSRYRGLLKNKLGEWARQGVHCVFCCLLMFHASDIGRK